ncbi:MAG: signal peptidase I [Verrucomicrobiaceae bacterium]|nr:signal peptidase I [Verrucomicrobiaceae bacterium]
MFTKRYIKHGKLLVRHAEKLLRYRSDVLSEGTILDLKTQTERVRQALRDKNEKAVTAESEKLHALYTQHLPAPKDAAWRENVEVILVAIVVAVGIRSYFLQPFKIPTGSMQPTLNGIIGHRIDPKTPLPNFLQQIGEYFILGRNYINVVAAKKDTIKEIVPKKYGFFFTFSEIRWEDQKPTMVYAPPETLLQDFMVQARLYQKGETIARGAVDTGDQVFVDKFSYNFVKPRRGDVFVFRTEGINERNEKEGIIHVIQYDPASGPPFFIKRLAGVPGDSLRVDPPFLYVNGELAQGFGFNRVMERKNGYQGYSNPPNAPYLNSSKSTYYLPDHSYFAMGDNSYNSSDSRYWGRVPEENLVGRGLFVYWPFNWHWGFIR